MLRVLIADRSIAVQDLTREVLLGMGGVAATVTSGSDALDMLEERGFDIVLLEWPVPQPKGAGVVAELQTRWPQLAIIAMGESGSIPSHEEARQLGVRRLEKPFGSSELIWALAAAIGSRLQ